MTALCITLVTGAAEFAHSVCAAPPVPSDSFGINYLPANQYQFLNSQWATAEPEIDRDLAIMAGLGVRVIRVMMDTHVNGVTFHASGGATLNAGTINTTAQNINRLLAKLERFNMKLILSFQFFPLLDEIYNDADPTRAIWIWAYGDTPQGWANFISDMSAWELAIIRNFSHPIENGAHHNTIAYYDVWNEWRVSTGVDGVNANTGTMLRAILGSTALPSSRIGISTGGTQNNATLNVIANHFASQSKTVENVDGHNYWGEPFEETPAQYQSGLQDYQNRFPNACVWAAEWGSALCVLCPNPPHDACESTQADRASQIYQAAIASPAVAALNFQLWDSATGTCGRYERMYGLGYAADLPRDSFGVFADQRTMIPGGGDFESHAPQTDGWSVGVNAGGSNPLLCWNNNVCPTSGSLPATGERYLRAQITRTGYVCSPPFGVSPGRLGITGYLRVSNADSPVTLDVHRRQASTGLWDPTSIKKQALAIAANVDEANAQWRNIQSYTSTGDLSYAGKVAIDVPIDTDLMTVCFTAGAPCGCGSCGTFRIDIDGLSVAAF